MDREVSCRFFGPVHHPGLVVEDCAAAAAFYEKVWGLKNVEFHVHNNAQSFIRGKLASYFIKIARGDLGAGGRLELIEAIFGGALHCAMCEREGEGEGEGLNHIAFLVDNLDDVMERGDRPVLGLPSRRARNGRTSPTSTTLSGAARSSISINVASAIDGSKR